MAKYRITDPQTGKTVTVSGDKAPTQADAEGIFQSAGLRQPRPQQPAQEAPDNRGFMEKAQNFLAQISPTIANIGALGLSNQTEESQKAGNQSSGAFKLSNDLIQRAKQTSDPQEKQALLNEARAIMQGSEQQMDQFRENLAGKQRAAGISERDLDRGDLEFALRRGASQGLEQLAFLAPQAQLGKLAPTGVQQTTQLGNYLKAIPGADTASQRIAGATLAGSVPGAITGSSVAARESDSVSDATGKIAGSALLSGLISGGLQVGAEGVRKGAELFKKGSEKAGKDLITRSIKPNRTQLRKFEERAKQPMADFLDDEGIRGNIGESVLEKTDELQSKYTEIANNKNIKVSTSQIEKARKEALGYLNKVAQKSKVKAVNDYADELIQIAKDSGDNAIPLADLNAIKQGFDKEIPKSAFARLFDPSGTISNKVSQRMFTQSLMNQSTSGIKTASGAGLKDLGSRLSKYYALQDIIDEQILLGKGTNLLSLTDVITVSPAIAAGNPPAAIGSIALKRLANNPTVQQSAGSALLNTSKSAPVVAPSTIGPVAQGAASSGIVVNPIRNAIERALDKEKEVKQKRGRLPGVDLRGVKLP